MALNVGNLQNEAQQRKERLKLLRKKPDEGELPSKRRLLENNEGKLPKPVFRSYKPTDENLKANELPKVKPVEVTEHVKEQLKDSAPVPLVEEVDLTNLAPRKPDWDLKRDIARKLAKLEKRTQRAIAEIIRVRMQAGDGDLATAVKAAPGQDDDD